MTDNEAAVRRLRNYATGLFLKVLAAFGLGFIMARSVIPELFNAHDDFLWWAGILCAVFTTVFMGWAVVSVYIDTSRFFAEKKEDQQ